MKDTCSFGREPHFDSCSQLKLLIFDTGLNLSFAFWTSTLSIEYESNEWNEHFYNHL